MARVGPQRHKKKKWRLMQWVENEWDQKLNMTNRQADKEQGKVKVTDRQTDIESRKGMFGVTRIAALT
jgi:hypothetical protein